MFGWESLWHDAIQLEYHFKNDDRSLNYWHMEYVSWTTDSSQALARSETRSNISRCSECKISLLTLARHIVDAEMCVHARIGVC
jgi:hypothetical protein